MLKELKNIPRIKCGLGLEKTKLKWRYNIKPVEGEDDNHRTTSSVGIELNQYL